MFGNRFGIVLAVLTVFAFARNAMPDNPLTKAREDVRVQEEVKQAADEWRQSDRSHARNTRERIADRLREIESAVDKLAKTFARWKEDVRPLLTNDAGRRIAADPALRQGFLNVYSELNPKFDTAHAESLAAKQFVQETRKFLSDLEKKETAYAPSGVFQRRIDEAGEKVVAWQQSFVPAVAKVDLWIEITSEKAMHELTLDELLARRGAEGRPAEAVGKDQSALRQSAYELTAQQFAVTLKAESGVRRGSEFIATLRAMSGTFLSRRNRPDLPVTFKINERTLNSFSGKMFLNSGDEVCDVSGRFDGSVFLCEIQRSTGRMTLKGAVKGDVVSGDWSIGRGNDNGTFRFDLSRDEVRRQQQ